MESSESKSLYSPLSITRELWPWCLWAICLLTVTWTVLITWSEVSNQNHPGILETSIAVGSKASSGVPIIVVYSILGVMIGNFILGGGIMVMARATKEYLYDKIERQRERLRQEGRKQGIEQGRASLAAEVADWNARRLEAEKRGEPFNEPPPDA